MKMTTAMMIRPYQLLDAIEVVKLVYGPDQMIFVQGEGDKVIFRGTVS
jgi:hypothetical protein